jgi:hypothetical protein
MELPFIWHCLVAYDKGWSHIWGLISAHREPNGET